MAKRVDLLNDNIVMALTNLSLPIMGMSLLQMAYNLTDMFWIGKLGAGAVAAIGTGGLFVWLSMGIHTLAQLGKHLIITVFIFLKWCITQCLATKIAKKHCIFRWQ